jgi:hypothetical protein
MSDILDPDDDTNEGLILGVIESVDDADKRDDDSDNGQENNNE